MCDHHRHTCTICIDAAGNASLEEGCGCSFECSDNETGQHHVFDDDDLSCTKYEGNCLSCEELEEAYELKVAATKWGKRSSKGWATCRPKAKRGQRWQTKKAKQRDRARYERKCQQRKEDRDAQLQARKDRAKERRHKYGLGFRSRRNLPNVCNSGQCNTFTRMCKHCRTPSSQSQIQTKYEGSYGEEILPAEELGLENGHMFERLLEILDGDEITPEDFELLSLLDANNEKTTLDEAHLSDLEILKVGESSNGKEGSLLYEELADQFCVVCLEPFHNLTVGAELRRLPCNHVYCKGCIDEWLRHHSIRCPDLSCYWTRDKG